MNKTVYWEKDTITIILDISDSRKNDVIDGEAKDSWNVNCNSQFIIDNFLDKNFAFNLVNFDSNESTCTNSYGILSENGLLPKGIGINNKSVLIHSVYGDFILEDDILTKNSDYSSGGGGDSSDTAQQVYTFGMSEDGTQLYASYQDLVNIFTSESGANNRIVQFVQSGVDTENIYYRTVYKLNGMLYRDGAYRVSISAGHISGAEYTANDITTLLMMQDGTIT